jgi:hypothetical protein
MKEIFQRRMDAPRLRGGRLFPRLPRIKSGGRLAGHDEVDGARDGIEVP